VHTQRSVQLLQLRRRVQLQVAPREEAALHLDPECQGNIFHPKISNK
jgi:hypothetical protein